MVARQASTGEAPARTDSRWKRTRPLGHSTRDVRSAFTSTSTAWSPSQALVVRKVTRVPCPSSASTQTGMRLSTKARPLAPGRSSARHPYASSTMLPGQKKSTGTCGSSSRKAHTISSSMPTDSCTASARGSAVGAPGM